MGDTMLMKTIHSQDESFSSSKVSVVPVDSYSFPLHIKKSFLKGWLGDLLANKFEFDIVIYLVLA